MNSEWKHLLPANEEPKRSQDLLIIAFAFIFYFPGLFLLWKFPFDSKGTKIRYRVAALTVVVPLFWAYAYLFYRLAVLVINVIRRKTQH